MHWYQHLPGTDWWKVAKDTYNAYRNPSKNQYNNYGAGLTRSSRLGAAYKAFKNVASGIKRSASNYFRGEKDYYSKKFNSAIDSKKKDIRFRAEKSLKDYDAAENSNYAKNPGGIGWASNMQFLRKYAGKQIDDGKKLMQEYAKNPSLMNAIKLGLNDLQYKGALNLSKYFANATWDDKVTNFIGNITGGVSSLWNKIRGNKKSGSPNH